MSKRFIFRSFDNSKLPSPELLTPSDCPTKRLYKNKTPVLPALPRSQKLSLKLPLVTENSDSFPNWLLSRSDFLKILSPKSEDLEIGKICEKDCKQRDEVQKKELLEYINSCVFFKPLGKYTCREVCSRLFTKRFEEGETIIREGEAGDCMYLIVSGKVEIISKGKYLGSVGANNVIGEAALENNCFRSATVRSINKVTTLVLNKEDYSLIISRQRHMIRAEIVMLLKKIPVFQDLLTAKLERIAWQTLIFYYNPGHVIYEQGKKPFGVYFVKQGEVNLIFTTNIKVKGKIPGNQNLEIGDLEYKLEVRKVKEGDFFGEQELLEGINRKTSAVCKYASILLFIKDKKFKKNLTEAEQIKISKMHEKMKSVKMLANECIKNYNEETDKSKFFLNARKISFDRIQERDRRHSDLDKINAVNRRNKFNRNSFRPDIRLSTDPDLL